MHELSELEIVAWHESLHANVGMSRGCTPSLIEVHENGSGSCRFQQRLSDADALLVGMAGELGCELFLGVPGTASEQDVSLCQPQWQRLFTSGRRDRVQQDVLRESERLCWELRPQIEFLAGRLMKTHRVDRGQLGRLCRVFQPLRQFAGLFPRPQVTAAIQQRRQAARQRPALRPDRRLVPTRAQGRYRLTPDECQAVLDKITAQVMAGKSLPIMGIPLSCLGLKPSKPRRA